VGVRPIDPAAGTVGIAGRTADFDPETTWISDLTAPSDGTPVPTFAIATPVLTLDRFERIATLVARVHLGRWLATMRAEAGPTQSPEGGEPRLILRDRSGTTLTIPRWFRSGDVGPSGTIPEDESLGLKLVGPGPPGPAGHRGRHVCLNGREVLGHDLPLGTARWAVLTETDADVALAVVSGLQSRFIAFGLVIAAICSVLFYFPFRYLIQPLSELRDAAEAMRRGDRSRRVEVQTHDEIGQLSNAFNEMAEAVDARTADLRVAAKELEAREEQLRAERDRLRLVIGSMSDGLMFLDPSGKVLLANDAAQPLVEAFEAEGKAREIGDRICPGDTPLDPAEGGCATCLKAGERDHQACVIDVGSSVFEVRSSELPKSGSDGAGRVLVLRDITSRVNQETRQTHQERLAVVGEVAAVVAHELNNPLAAIRMFVQMLEEEAGPESPFQEHVEVIGRNVDACRKTIRGLLEFASAGEPERGVYDLHELLREVGRFLRPLARRADIALELDLEATDPEVIGDELQVRQVFVNLVLNAIQASDGAGSRVALRTRQAEAGSGVEIEVDDDGPGISSRGRKRIFDTFFTTKAKGTGTGLGLPISRRILEAHGGSVELVESRPGRTLFRVNLPRNGRPSMLGLRPLPMVMS
ncbi:MAG: sensor histidine kinase, partial [Planctomycetota bacterium]|jgi:signal transduction histidine kinase